MLYCGPSWLNGSGSACGCGPRNGRLSSVSSSLYPWLAYQMPWLRRSTQTSAPSLFRTSQIAFISSLDILAWPLSSSCCAWSSHFSAVNEIFYSPTITASDPDTCLAGRLNRSRYYARTQTNTSSCNCYAWSWIWVCCSTRALASVLCPAASMPPSIGCWENLTVSQ